MATSNHTENYNLSQYAAGDPVKFLTNYNQDMSAIDAAVKAAQDSADAKTPLTRTIADLPLSADITLAQLIAAGLASGTNGDANNALKLAGVDATAIIDGEGNALNALKLGGVDAINFPQISSGTWTPTLYGATTAGTVTCTYQIGRFTKIGDAYFVWAEIDWSNISDMAGNIRIGGFPAPGSAAIKDQHLDMLSPSIVNAENFKLLFNLFPNMSYGHIMGMGSGINTDYDTSKLYTSGAGWIVLYGKYFA